METHWERAEIQCLGCREILVLQPLLLDIWCPWCEEPYEIRETSHHVDPTRVVLTLIRKSRSDRRG